MPQGKISQDNTKLTVVITKDFKEELQNLALADNRTLSNLVINVLKNYVKDIKSNKNDNAN